jgi:hypothetical protein
LFNYPEGPGKYEFYSLATDGDGNVEPAPVSADALVIFTPPSYQLALDFTGTGSGQVSFSTGGTCTGDCLRTFTGGTAVTMSAVPDGGSTVGGWKGCDTVNGNDCTITMTGERGVTAVFDQSVSPPPVAVPAMGLWGLLIAAGGLGFIGMQKARNKD